MGMFLGGLKFQLSFNEESSFNLDILNFECFKLSLLLSCFKEAVIKFKNHSPKMDFFRLNQRGFKILIIPYSNIRLY